MSPRRALALLLGFALGLAGFTFVYGEGPSYLTRDPGACANCHLMQPWYDSWSRSSHRRVACADCHMPGDFVGGWAMKAYSGALHSWGFTTGLFDEPLRAHGLSRRVVQQRCVDCHAPSLTPGLAGDSCVRCHRGVGH